MVYHFIKTATTIKNDARVRKWIKTFNDWKIDANVVGFVVEEKNWKDDFVSVETLEIWFRKFFSIGNGRIFKIAETTIRLIPRILKAKPGTIFVYHDNQLYLTILVHAILKRSKKHLLVWDMHELPHAFLLNRLIFKNVLRFMLKRFDYCFITNEHRGNYINLKLGTNISFKVLNNYPTLLDLDESQKALPKALENWLNEKESYALWIGNPSEKRNFPPFYKSCKLLGLKMIILGKTNKETEYINEDENCKVLFVDPAEIIDYIDNSAISAVFYKGVNKNNWFCEPNRLYLLMSRGASFIAGNNPPIKQSLENYPFSMVLNSDAPNQEEVLKGIKQLLNKENEGKERVRFGKDFLLDNNMIWEDQISKFEQIFKN